ncbi:MAG: hypothetical protein HC915_18385 [Anaerolineae bacterium]|nr:hypothetical protein [Anaerolineae bacterium]
MIWAEVPSSRVSDQVSTRRAPSNSVSVATSATSSALFASTKLNTLARSSCSNSGCWAGSSTCTQAAGMGSTSPA